MVTNAKQNEHPRCGCRSCRRGASSEAGKFVHKQVNRKIRRRYKAALKKLDGETPRIIVSTPYTD